MQKLLLMLVLLVAVSTSALSSTSPEKTHAAKLPKSISKSWIFGCESKGHKAIGAYAETTYADYITCHNRKQSHLRVYPNHDCGCR